jgi:hypothetical protein
MEERVSISFMVALVRTKLMGAVLMTTYTEGAVMIFSLAVVVTIFYRDKAATILSKEIVALTF